MSIMPIKKVKSFTCICCGKERRSSVSICNDKSCDYEKLRYTKKKSNKAKEMEEHILIKHDKKKMHEEIIRKAKTILI